MDIKRPLSPHLQIYKWQISMLLSIAHRATGIALVGGTLLLAYWLICLSAGEKAYISAHTLLSGWFGRSLLFGWTFAFYLHLATGVRHLFWDIGYGFDLTTTYRTNGLILFFTFGMTLLTWGIFLFTEGR